MNTNYTCPYCGTNIPDSSLEYIDNVECSSCEKIFGVRIEYEPVKILKPLDCLNGLAEHKWLETFWGNELECEVCYTRIPFDPEHDGEVGYHDN